MAPWAGIRAKTDSILEFEMPTNPEFAPMDDMGTTLLHPCEMRYSICIYMFFRFRADGALSVSCGNTSFDEVCLDRFVTRPNFRRRGSALAAFMRLGTREDNA